MPNELALLKDKSQKPSGQVIVQFVHWTNPSPAARDKTLANQKGLGPELAQWIKWQIKVWTPATAWKQIKLGEPDVQWSDSGFSSGERPSINVRISFAN